MLTSYLNLDLDLVTSHKTSFVRIRIRLDLLYSMHTSSLSPSPESPTLTLSGCANACENSLSPLWVTENYHP